MVPVVEESGSAQRAAAYRDFIALRSRANPCIAGLGAYAARRPLHQSTVVLLEYLDGPAAAPAEPQTVTDPARLHHLLCSAVPPGLKGRVLLVENITPELVGILGSTLDVDPAFFAGHINTDFQDLEKAPAPPSLALLPSQLAENGFLHVHYQLAVDLGHSETFRDSAYALKTYANVPRSVRRLPPLDGKQLGLARGCCSIVVAALGHNWVCLVLTDPPIRAVMEPLRSGGTRTHASRPLHGGLEEFTAPVRFSRFYQGGHDAGMPRDETKGSVLHSVVGYLRGRSGAGPAASRDGRELTLDFGYYPVRMALAAWVMYVHVISRYLKYYEYSLQDADGRLHNSDLVDLQRWRRRCKQSLQKLGALRAFVDYQLGEVESHDQGENPASLGQTAGRNTNGALRRRWGPVLQDIDYIESQLRGYNQSLEQMIPVATSIVQLLESRRSLVEATSTTRLTYIALVFVPLSWLASLFSMTDQYLPGHEQFWVYPATALPLIFALVLASVILNREKKPAQILRVVWEMLERSGSRVKRMFQEYSDRGKRLKSPA